MNINVEYITNGKFEKFENKLSGKKVVMVYDKNTKPFAIDLKNKTKLVNYIDVFFDDSDYIPTMENCEIVVEKAKDADYVLAVGSGSLNDTAKYAATKLNLECGVFATAASMDGYASNCSALMDSGKKVTVITSVPSDILIDLDVVTTAPRIMMASGFGDIIGKFTCLTDWRLSNLLNGEEINKEAYVLMEKARTDCVSLFDGLVENKAEAVAKLMDALITSGISMAICGNSRPASGSEHHMSHFLEMDFVARGEKIPMHGIKVAMGTLVSIDIYNYLVKSNIEVPKKDEITSLVDCLPKVEELKNMLEKIGCPTRFSQIGVRRETMEEMLEKAYLVRNRFTILTLFNQIGMPRELKDYLMDKYF